MESLVVSGHLTNTMKRVYVGGSMDSVITQSLRLADKNGFGYSMFARGVKD